MSEWLHLMSASSEGRMYRINTAHIVRYWPSTTGTGLIMIGDEAALHVLESATAIDRMLSDMGADQRMVP